MEFIIQRSVFLEGIQKTLGIVDKKTTMPILNNVLIRTDKDKLTISATDLEIGLIADYEAQIIQPGDITLSAKKLHEMIREMQGEAIQFTKSDRDLVTMTCDKAIYRIQGLQADDFPRVIQDEGVQLFQISTQGLAELIHKTDFAISTDPLRKNLTGALFEIVQGSPGEVGSIKMVATDGHRLAMASLPQDVSQAHVPEKGIIIPRKGLQEIRRNVEDIPDHVSFGVHQGMCIVRAQDMMLKVRLIDGDYPDYRRVLPAEKGVAVQFTKEKVLHALRRMKVISSDSYQGVILKLFTDRMELHSTNPDVGEANDEIDVTYKDQEMELAYNVNFLIEAIEVIDEDHVLFEMGGPRKAGVIRALSNDQYRCIIMPLRY